MLADEIVLLPRIGAQIEAQPGMAVGLECAQLLAGACGLPRVRTLFLEGWRRGHAEPDLALGIERQRAQVGAGPIGRERTPAERERPEILNARCRERIAKGSGTTMADVNRLLKQFDDTRKMMKMVAGGGKMKLPQMPRGFRR